MSERKLVYIARVTRVIPIENADKICQYEINEGWKAVDLVGKYSVGDAVVYAECDCWIPHTLAPFLSKGKTPREYCGVPGERLRTIRLRSALSQGLILPTTVLDGVLESEWIDGLDVTVPLGIQKWEPPPEFTSADAKGSFPSCIPKTDQPRIQTEFHYVKEYFDNFTWECTEKLEGTSSTFFFNNGEYGVCSRNLELKPDETNTYWKMSVKYDIENKLRTLGSNIAIQGEIVGPSICGNIYELKEHMLFVYAIFDIDNQAYLSPRARKGLLKSLDLPSVPVLASNFSLHEFTLDRILEGADGTSVLGTISTLREGLVFVMNDVKRVNFKAVSNKYLERSA